MAPKKKKGGASKEELEKIAREQEEQVRLQELLQREHEAEERQKRENEKRDAEEEEERKRVKKEEQLRLIAEKETRILALTAELDNQKTLFAAERLELESELERMLQLKDSLLNEISILRSEGDDVQRKLLEERQQIASELDQLRVQHHNASREFEAARSSLSCEVATHQTRLEALSHEHDELKQELSRRDRDSTSRIKNLERELEKTLSLNKTLQDVIEAREADDRKNVTLMQLLNNQLDENKRRSQELIEEERQRTSRARQELVQLETRHKQLQEETDLIKREKDVFKQQADADLQDYRSKLEQMKFDMKYLHSELHSFKTQCSKHQQEASQIKATAATETHSARIEVESFQKKLDEVEALLRRKDREHFDKVTFLNAQISNNRTIIAQLQQKLARERDDRHADHTSSASEINTKALAIQSLTSEMEQRKMIAYESESKLTTDVSILKTTVFQLQSALVDREKEIEAVKSSKDMEIKRLRTKLDEHFIPHRADENDSTQPSPEIALYEKVASLSRELEVRNHVALENESRLTSQISNQNHIIDSLQAELHKAKADWQAEVKSLDLELSRLKKILEVNFIPFEK